MGNLIDLKEKRPPSFQLRGDALKILTRTLHESGQFQEPLRLDALRYPVYTMEALQNLAGGGLLLEKDFLGAYPVHFALIVLGTVYQRSTRAIMTEMSKTKGPQGVLDVQDSPMALAGEGLVQYTANCMLMQFYQPETYHGERFLLVFNPLTEKVELWAGLPLHTDTQDENTTAEPAENPGAAPAEEK